MNRLKGIIMIISGAALWGATGPLLEWLLNNSQMSIPFILISRLTLAGGGLLVYLKLKKKQITLPLRQKVWLRQIIIFGVVGMLGVQYAFVASIDTSNAVIATLFQFLAPIYIIIFVSLRQKKKPPTVQVLGMSVTIIGLFFLLTNGSISGFVLSNEALFWGLVVGFTFAFYTLYPVRIMQEWGVILTVGWAMLIGGLTLFIVNSWTFVKEVQYLTDLKMAGMLIFIIIVGTVAFLLFLGSMSYITPVETSVLSSFEPLTAMVISVLWFGELLGKWQLAGAIIMLVGVTWLSIAGGKAKKKNIEKAPDPH
ncbi:DMT family transporter [Sporosarcina sp. HYO08]|uniref:DMT family transporter n=1 Tax=Sporosarcina sp. HYO08 TaxID=1759557 RepID=UPI000795C052|nr:EamA family transporter [Sporosarcina sp. HYO08]KXH83887.1 multidrug transporter [Sporosarcina sp. HYO08]